LYEGVKETIKFLNKKGHKLYLLSSQPQKILELQLKNLDIYKYFSSIIGDIHNKEDGIKELLDVKNLKAIETICIGDTVGEIEAGKKLNLITIGITWGFNSKKQLKLAKPDYILDNISNFPELLDS
jgi:phosphoglycolate phosphatase